MAIDAAVKKEYNSRTSEPKQQISDLEKDIALYHKAQKDNEKLAPFFHVGIAAKLLEQANLYIDMSILQERLMQIKNQGFLDKARSIIPKVISEMDKVVTLEVDEPLDFNREHLHQIKPFNPNQRVNFVKHFNRTIDRLVDAYGDTKWKWSFPEFWAKAAVIAKNLTDFREIQAIRNPNAEFFYDRKELLELVKHEMFRASEKYRDKFNFKQTPSDLVTAINLLESLRRIGSLTGDSDLVSRAKAGIDAYKARIESKGDGKSKPEAKPKKGRRKKK